MKFRRLSLTLILLVIFGGVGYWRWYEWRDHSQDVVIRAASRRYSVEPALVKAVVWRESRFNPHARGKAGEFGLMQVRDTAAGEWAHAEKIKTFSRVHLLDPGTNTLAGTWYLQKLLKRYERTDNPLPYALADYNAGRSNVLRWARESATTNSVAFLERIDFGGTRKYVQSVRRRYEHYRPSFKPAE